MSGERQGFEEFVAKFRDCFRSVEVRIVCGRKGSEWRNIWTRVDLSPDSYIAFNSDGNLPQTDVLWAMHFRFPAAEVSGILDGIEAGVLSRGSVEVVYLSDSHNEGDKGLRLSGMYLPLETGSGRVSDEDWGHWFLWGNGPYPLNGYLDVEGHDLDLHLQGLRHSYGSLWELCRAFGKRTSLGAGDQRTAVKFVAPLMMRLDKPKCVEGTLTVSVIGSPAFTSQPAHVNLVEGEGGRRHAHEPYDLPQEGWQEAGDFAVTAFDAPLVQYPEMFTLRLVVRGTPAHGCRLRRGSAIEPDMEDFSGRDPGFELLPAVDASATDDTWSGPTPDEDEEPLGGAARATAETQHGGSTSRSVFVVHGRDEGALREVEDFLRSLSLEPVVLYKQPNRGRTIIEKFEQHADVGFAVVLLTPDDYGHHRDVPQCIEERARQNVILELGYFLAKLGRERVCALKKGGVEAPSDIHGVLWVEMAEDGKWREQLVREMQEAGLECG